MKQPKPFSRRWTPAIALIVGSLGIAGVMAGLSAAFDPTASVRPKPNAAGTEASEGAPVAAREAPTPKREAGPAMAQAPEPTATFRRGFSPPLPRPEPAAPVDPPPPFNPGDRIVEIEIPGIASDPPFVPQDEKRTPIPGSIDHTTVPAP